MMALLGAKLFSPPVGGSGPKRFLGNVWVDGGILSFDNCKVILCRALPPIPHFVGTSPRKRGEENLHTIIFPRGATS